MGLNTGNRKAVNVHKTLKGNRVVTETTLDQYRDLLEQKIRLVTDYKDATREIKDTLNQNNSAMLRGGIQKRQQLIKRIDGVDDRIRALNIRYSHTHGDSGKLDHIIAAQIKNIEQMLGSIAAMDGNCVCLAESERDNMKRTILHDQQKRKGTKGYRPSGAGRAKFVDTRIR